MAGKSIRLLQIITSPHLYRELFRWLVYYLYEHVLPLKNLQVGTDPEIHPTVSLRFEKNIHLGVVGVHSFYRRCGVYMVCKSV